MVVAYACEPRHLRAQQLHTSISARENYDDFQSTGCFHARCGNDFNRLLGQQPVHWPGPGVVPPTGSSSNITLTIKTDIPATNTSGDIFVKWGGTAFNRSQFTFQDFGCLAIQGPKTCTFTIPKGQIITIVATPGSNFPAGEIPNCGGTSLTPTHWVSIVTAQETAITFEAVSPPLATKPSGRLWNDLHQHANFTQNNEARSKCSRPRCS